MAEFHVEDTVVNKAEIAGWFCRKVGWLGRRGAPDRFFAKDGRALFIEFKDRGKPLDAIQEREIERMILAGVEVRVVDKVEDGLQILGIKP